MKIKYTLKAGTILINLKEQKIGLIFRKNHNDYEFPKGHLESFETLPNCAIRETAEETKRNVVICKNFSPIIAKYRTPKGEYCKCYYYFAIDQGKSDNSSLDTHNLLWVNSNDVFNLLTHQSLKSLWLKAKNKVDLILKSNLN